jgi:hypothetical protein
VFIDQVEKPYAATVMRPCADEVVAPHVVAMRRSEPYTWDRGAELLPLAERVRRVAGGPGEAAEGVGAGELQAEASGCEPEPG